MKLWVFEDSVINGLFHEARFSSTACCDPQEPIPNKMQTGKHGVIVLNPGRRPSLHPRNKSQPESEDLQELPESNDPAVIRKIVRRQAALASAGRRKATIAATQKRTSVVRRQYDASGTAPSNDRTFKQEHIALSLQQIASPAAFAIACGQFDPFRTHPVDFNSVKDSNVLYSLFKVFMSNVAPLLDLRLPTQDDRRYGRHYSWQKELPKLDISCPPCFGSLRRAAAAPGEKKNINDSASQMMILKFRHMAIRSINRRLDASATGLQNDFGLLIGIAILGSWEHWFGSREACQAHCDGLRLLQSHFKDQEQPHDLKSQIMTFANTFGTKSSAEQQGPRYAPELPRIVELETDTNVGFSWMQGRTYLDQRLVRSCQAILKVEKMAPGPERAQALREIASTVLSFNTKPRLKDITVESDWSRDQNADRINLEVHIILQATGVSLVTFLADNAEEAGTKDIDVGGMCEEVADLARSVVCLPLYDQILLWALVTVFALSNRAPEKGIEVVRTLLQRLQLHMLPLEGVETYMEAFVFLDTARDKYRRLLRMVMTSPEPEDAKPQNPNSSSSCQTQ